MLTPVSAARSSQDRRRARPRRPIGRSGGQGQGSPVREARDRRPSPPHVRQVESRAALRPEQVRWAPSPRRKVHVFDEPRRVVTRVQGARLDRGPRPSADPQGDPGGPAGSGPGCDRGAPISPTLAGPASPVRGTASTLARIVHQRILHNPAMPCGTVDLNLGQQGGKPYPAASRLPRAEACTPRSVSASPFNYDVGFTVSWSIHEHRRAKPMISRLSGRPRQAGGAPGACPDGSLTHAGAGPTLGLPRDDCTEDALRNGHYV